MANSPARAIEVGAVVANTYTVESLIGRGGMGSVYLASHNRLPGKQVAIKILHADLEDPDVIARFKHEAEIASRLGHPNIVGVHDFNVTAEGTPYLVLEYLEGESLAQRLKRGPLPLDTVFSITRQVGSALAAAHREGIVHRDLKPQNIFLVPTEVDGKIVEIAKVLDFGISKVRGSTTVKTQESALLGTPQYMAPEQAKGDHEHVDARTDVFALGAIVYEMLAGHPAFSGESIPEVVYKVVHEQPRPLADEAPTVPPGVIATVNQAMSKAAAERFGSVSTFVEKLTGEKVAPPHRLPTPRPIVDDAGSVSGGRSTGKEAFAQTQHPADHSHDETLAPSQPQGPIVSPQAQTVESLAAIDRTPRPTASPPRRRSPWAIAAIAVASAAVGAMVLFLVIRSGGSSTPVDAAPVVAASDAAIEPPVVAIEAAPVSTDADVAVEDADDDTEDAAPIADAKPRSRLLLERDDQGQGVADARRAASAFRAKDYDTAERIATEVINSPTASPGPIARARAIRGAVMCVARNHEERARIELRQIPPRFGAARGYLIMMCKRAGYLAN